MSLKKYGPQSKAETMKPIDLAGMLYGTEDMLSRAARIPVLRRTYEVRIYRRGIDKTNGRYITVAGFKKGEKLKYVTQCFYGIKEQKIYPYVELWQNGMRLL